MKSPMSSDFDPYRKWLGILPKDQPPNHYRLLGIELFESDPDVISNAADARMAHVRSFQTGPYSDLSQKILNEIAAAKVCLLNPEKKSQYDAQLRAQLAAQGLWAPPAAPILGWIPGGTETGWVSPTGVPQSAIPTTPVFPISGGVSGEAIPQQGVESPFSAEPISLVSLPGSAVSVSRELGSRRKSWQGPVLLLLGAAGVVVLLVLLIWVLQRGPDSREITSAGGSPERSSSKNGLLSPATTPETQSTGISPKTVPGTSSKTTKSSPKDTLSGPSQPDSKPSPKPESKPGLTPSDHPSKQDIPGEPKTPSESGSEASGKETPSQPESPGPSKSESSQEETPAGPNKEPVGTEKPSVPGKPSSEEPSETQPEEKPKPKLPVPSADQQTAAEQQIRSLLKENFALADKGGTYGLLAQKLLQHARETTDQPAAQYMLFRMAAESAARAAEGLLLHEAVDGLAQHFEADARQIIVAALEKAANAPADENVIRSLVQLIQDTGEEAMAEDDYAAADRLAKAALAAARKGKDPELIREVTPWVGKIERLAQEFAKVQEHLDKLAQNPDDPEANLVVGRWYAFQTGQWERGLPYLAKGSQQELAEVARRDLEGPQEAGAQQELGNRWWDLSEKASPEDRLVLAGRAVYWYEQALPALTGLSKTSLERRIETYRTTVAQKEPTRIKKGEYVLFFDGQKTHVIVPNFRYDGTKPLTVEVTLTPASINKKATIVGNMTAMGGWGVGLFDLRRVWSEGIYWAFLFRTQLRRADPAYAGSNTPVRLAGQRTMLAAVYDGQEVRLYLNGEKQWGNSSVRGPHRPGRPLLVIGAFQDETGPPSDFFHGTIEELRISFTARYTTNFSPPAHLEKDKSTEVLFHFDTGQGNTIRDASNARRTARIIGGKWVKRETSP